MTSTPRWRIDAGRLTRDGRPALLLGGQVHNSSSSTEPAIAASFAHAHRMGASTVLAPVAWAQLEPHEGELRFALVDAMLDTARQRGLRLVLLWFGAFKNAASTYAPTWVRADPARFPRVRIEPKGLQAFSYEGATPKPVLSVFSPELREADARAFAALMSYLADADHDGTVAAVQVENETGLLSDSRDRSAAALERWSAPVPQRLVAWLGSDASGGSIARSLWDAAGRRTAGSWPELLGDGWEADEAFMAWAFASYVEHVAAAGRAAFDVPLLANAWLGPQPGQVEAGQWPSGGPGARVLDLWRLAAPSIDILAPDIYTDDVEAPMRDYRAGGNPLLIPECRPSASALALAVGAHGAIGWSAFGIDDGNPDGQVAAMLRLLGVLEQEITIAQAAGRIAAVVLDDGAPDIELRLGDLDVTVRGTEALLERMLLDVGVQRPERTASLPDETLPHAPMAQPGETRPFGVLLLVGDALFVIGRGITVDVASFLDRVEIDAVEALTAVDGRFVVSRVINGDERLQIVPNDHVEAARMALLRLEDVAE